MSEQWELIIIFDTIKEGIEEAEALLDKIVDMLYTLGVEFSCWMYNSEDEQNQESDDRMPSG